VSLRFDSAEIAAATGGVVARSGPAGPLRFDSRGISAGEWFFALKGERFDAHDFLASIPRDAAGLVVTSPERVPADWAGGVVVVADGPAAVADLGRAARARIHHPVIGLTGSAGKTTTRALIALAVSPLGPVHQTAGNLNNHLGVPFTLLATPDDAAVSVVEMGTSAPGEITFLASIARPTIRLVVNVGAAHLEELGGIDGVAAEKGALFATAVQGDTACINLDDPRIAAMRTPTGVHRITYGRAPGARIQLLSATIDVAALATDAVWQTPHGTLTCRIPAPGAHFAHNATAALAVAEALHLDLAASAAAMAGYRPVGMRMRTEPLANGAIALNDTYNANPTSMEASLRVLASLGGRRAAVLGDMLELGKDEAAFHIEIAALAHALDLDLVVLVGPRMSAAAFACPGAWSAADGESLADRLRNWLQPGDRVLFKGSRGARVERILQLVRGD
jgi:UDP-N-acetylmuramoyl-tripeptide--D-alanyl-D-alanine ligase